jgi:multicomponent Na+:H+ antiporter subunit B
MNIRGRRLVLSVGLAGIALLLVAGATGLPDYGTFDGAYGRFLNGTAVAQRHATNVVTAVTLDYRGFDTMGEEFILFAAVLGVALLLRAQREEEEVEPSDESEPGRAPHDSDAVRELSFGLVGPAVLFGLYVVAHGHLSPGGGFQGGAILASAPLFMYLGGEYLAFRRLSPETSIEVAEGAGAGGFVCIGLAGPVAGGAFLFNFLPLGTLKDLFSAGTMPLLYTSIGLAVAAGFVLLLSEFLTQTLEIRRRSKSL